MSLLEALVTIAAMAVMSDALDGLERSITTLEQRVDALSRKVDRLLVREILADIPLALTAAGLVLAATKLG